MEMPIGAAGAAAFGATSQPAPKPKSPFIIRMGKKLRPMVNGAAARASVIPDAPVLDDSVLEWTAPMRSAWELIGAEAAEILKMRHRLPRLKDLSPDHAGIAGDGRWRCFFLYGYGSRIDGNCAQAPITSWLASHIPGLNSAFFSVLEPGAVIPPHRGVTKGLLTWHLGLHTPSAWQDCWMRVDDQRVHWREGASLLFDDTFQHEVRNDTNEYRVILLVQVERPMLYPLRLVPDLFLWGVKQTSFVRQARRNIARLEAASALLERE